MNQLQSQHVVIDEIKNDKEQIMPILRERMESGAAEEMEKLFQRVPLTREFHAGEWTERHYYQRHILETALRIEFNNEVDAFALYKIGFKDDPLATVLSKYLSEEYGHVKMFFRDLKVMGMTQEEIDSSKIFFSTEKLIGYLYHCNNQQGPLATMIWNWLVEWYSDRYNTIISNKAAEALDANFVKGTKSHIAFDESHDHDDLMWESIHLAVKKWGSEDLAVLYVERFVELIGDYFQELHDSRML